MNIKVPNEHPAETTSLYRIAIVGQSPGKDEEEVLRPFIGASGRFLHQRLTKANIRKETCFLGNVSPFRPSKDDMELLDWNGPEVQNGLAELKEDLIKFNPNLCLVLGKYALKAALGYEAPITKWRGSLFTGSSKEFQGRKCLASLHPANILRGKYEDEPIFCLDMKKAFREGRSPELVLPQRTFELKLTVEDVIARLQDIKVRKPTISIDIEGGVNSMSCISISDSPSRAFIVPFQFGQHVEWNEEEEKHVWKELADVLTDPDIPKILQNALYDLFVLQFSYNITVRGLVEDTMLKHWELYSELPKALDFQVSIYTNEPYYKVQRKATDKLGFYEYCCLDSAVTHEISNVLDKQLVGQSLNHYNFNMKMLRPILYMELRGMKYNKELATERLVKASNEAATIQHEINFSADPEGLSKALTTVGLLNRMRELFVYKVSYLSVKNFEDVIRYCKPSYYERATKAVSIIRQSEDMTDLDRGALSQLLGLGLNVSSNKQMVEYLYNKRGFPVIYKKEHGRLTNKPTTDALAILKTFKKTNDEVLNSILKLRSRLTQIENLNKGPDKDGRIRCGFNLVGSKTGRLSSYESPSGSGFNLQTVPKSYRDLFVADEGFWFFRIDLGGADGWTVAAHCATLGDRTMLDDYSFGLKPAKIISLMYDQGEKINSESRENLKEMSETVDSAGWIYFAFKRCQHGYNYGMAAQTLSDQVLQDSYKMSGEAVLIDVPTCTKILLLYAKRYPGVKRWQDKIKHQIWTTRSLRSATGQQRIFFGRQSDNQTLQGAYSHEPQANTTYVTNLAALRLWEDSENRIGGDRKTNLVIEPLHQNHDELCGQFPKDTTEWAVPRLRGYFDNELLIAGIRIKIPYEGGYGPNWKDCNVGVI